MAVIGLDGVGLPLVQDLTARGVMPRLAALLPAGTAAPMRSSIPTISSVSWTGFMTGQNPGKHGIYGFTDVKPGTLTTFFPNFGNVKSETLWDVAGRAGKRAIVLNVPNTYPARALNGLLVSGFVAVNLERAVYPPELLPRLREDGYKIDVDYLNADQRPEAFFADLAATLDARRRVYLRLLADEPWDLFIGVITECDRLHHYFWSQYVDPAAPHHARFLDFYRRLDDLLGALAEALPAGTPFFLVADHGHTLIHREFYPNAWLRAEGLLRFTWTRRARSSCSIRGASTCTAGAASRSAPSVLRRRRTCSRACAQGSSRCATRARARPPAAGPCRACSGATSCTTAPSSIGPPTWWCTSPMATTPRARSRSVSCSGGARSPACTPTPTRSSS